MPTIHCSRVIAPLLAIPLALFGPRAVAQSWLGGTPAIDIGDGFYVRIATDGEGTWIAVWHHNEQTAEGSEHEYDIMMSRSVDNGLTWSPATPLNNNASMDRGNDRWPDLAFDGNGTWHAVWHSNSTMDGLIGDDFDIMIAHSFDGGASWSDPAPLNTGAVSDTQQDYRPHVATDGNGNCVAVWRGHCLGPWTGGPHCIAVSRSSDYGVTWMSPITLQAPAPHAQQGEPGEVVTDGMGNWMIVWYAGGAYEFDTFISRSMGNGASWSPPTALNINAGGDDGNDFLPQLATDRQGTWVAVWHSFSTLGGTIGNDNDILYARSLDNGVTWTFPEPLNQAATDEQHGDYEPHVATDESGNWVVVWYSEAFGNAFDILISRSTDGARTWTTPEVLQRGGSEAPSFTPRLGTDRKGNWVASWQVGSLDPYPYPVVTDWHSDVLLSRFFVPLCDLIGDMNCDGVVTALDLIPNGGCAEGPNNINPAPECKRLDFDKDGDRDILDFAGFQRACHHP